MAAAADSSVNDTLQIAIRIEIMVGWSRSEPRRDLTRTAADFNSEQGRAATGPAISSFSVAPSPARRRDHSTGWPKRGYLASCRPCGKFLTWPSIHRIELGNKAMTRSDDKCGVPSRRRVIKGTIAVAAGLAAPTFLSVGSAFAAYPDRPIKIVVANTPGGPSDILARILAAEMQPLLGASVFVENRGGAGGNIGMGFAARAEPDGYTILLTTSAFVVNPGLYNTLPYDPFKDFVPIAEPAVNPHVFTVKADLKAKTMKEFIAMAKADPDKFNISTPPIGTTPQLQAEVLKLREGLGKMATSVYKGGGDAIKALLTGEVQISSGTLAPAFPHMKAGTIKALAQTGAARWVGLPDVPTMGEQGFNDFVFETYCALVAPAKVPPEIVAKLEKAVLDILAKPEMKKKLVESGFDVVAKDAKGHGARIAKEVPMFKKVIQDAGIKKL
jgi:tripartite-type tricarboxylate transporter receptor subunit TctC